ncbi:glutamine synthetase [Xylariomycetidae sp. FL2044]|nr:glutamine synthetase [Xylariomycetidae sp. FL2044]
MAERIEFKRLNVAIDHTPIIDNHAHPLLRLENIGKYPLLSVTSEAHGDGLDDCRSSLAHIRAVKHLAQELGCDETWEAVEAAIGQRRKGSYDSWVKQCLRGIETILVDDGLDGMDQVESYSWHDKFTQSKCKRIVRVEALATDIIKRHCRAATSRSYMGLDPFKTFREVVSEFRREIVQAVNDPEVVGFKSVICYRGGLDVSPPTDPERGLARGQKALEEIISNHIIGEHFTKLRDSPLNHIIVNLVASVIQESPAPRKPLQFHTGLGDSDITLAKSSPAHLQPFIRGYPEVPIVILHASYPWTREAGYLAMAYPNVYADIGEVFPQLSRHGQEEVVRQILELCPWKKILWSTDGHWFPETYFLATKQVRSVLKTVLGELVEKQELSEKQAVDLVQDILFTNSKTLYNLATKTTLPTYANLALLPSSPIAAAAAADPSSPQAVLQKLQSMNAKYLRVYWHDYTSITKCRLLPINRVYKSLQSNTPFSLSITQVCLGLLPTDSIIPQITPTGAYALHPDWTSLRRGPVAGHASCFGTFTFPDGRPEPLCPRTVLSRTLERAASSHGLDFLLGFEIEFVVLEERDSNSNNRNNSNDPNPQTADENENENEKKYVPMRSSTGGGHAWSVARALADWGRPGSFTTVVDEILDALDAAGIAYDQFHPEAAPGQYELVLSPLAPLAACDALLHARQILESAAARAGFRVTLHPRPFADSIGTASHVHMSIVSDGGGGKGDDDPAVYKPFYAGILRHFRAVVAFTYAHPTSYERAAADSMWAGGRWVTWGTENKEAPLRKCGVDADGSGSHWEVKTFDGLANPYLAVAALLAAGTSGIAGREDLKRWRDCAVDPAKLDDEGRAALGIDTMFPAGLGEALRALEADREMVELMGERVVKRYVDVKNAEMELLRSMPAEKRRMWVLERY